MSDESVTRDVLLNLKLLADEGNKTAAENVRATVESLVEDMAAGYSLAREAAVKEANAAAQGQVTAAKKAADEISHITLSLAAAKAPAGATMPAALVNPGQASTSGTATMRGGKSGGQTDAEKDADAAEKAAKKKADAAEKAADREAAAALRAYSRIMKEREKNAADAEKQFDREANEAVKAYGRIMRERERLTKQLADAQSTQQELQQKATKNAAESLQAIVKMGRGFAELGILSEASSEAMLKGMIRIQAGFDIISGGIDLYVKLQESIRTATKALQAQAAAQAAVNAMSAAGMRNSTAAAGTAAAGGASRWFGTAAAGAGAAAAGGGGTAAAGGLMSALGSTLGGLATAAGALLAKFVALPLAAAEVIQFFGRLAGFKTESIIGAVLGMRNEQGKAAKSEKDFANAEKRQENARNVAKAKDEQSVNADSLVRAINEWGEKLAEANRTAGGGTDAQMAASSRNDIAARLQTANADVDAERAKREQAKAGHQVDARAGEDLARQRQVEMQEQLLEADKRRVQVLREQQKTQQEQVNTLKQQLQQAEKLVATERDQYRSTLARLGALTEAERRKAKEIGTKLEQGGELTEAEARFLQSAGIGGQKSDEYFAKKAQADGGDRTLDALGEGKSKLAEAEAERDRIARELAEAETNLGETTGSLNDAVQQLRDTILQTVDAVNAALKFQQETKGVPGQAPAQVTAPAQPNQQQPVDTAQIDKAAERVAQVQEQLTEAYVAALDRIAEQNAAALDEIRARQTRGALNAGAV